MITNPSRKGAPKMPDSYGSSSRYGGDPYHHRSHNEYRHAKDIGGGGSSSETKQSPVVTAILVVVVVVCLALLAISFLHS